MSRITIYAFQTFVETDDGLVAEEPKECQSAGEARMKAQMLAPRKAGVVAWAKSGDPDSGEWDDDPVILFKAGKTGK